jgi:hypothetical protein
MNFRDTCFCRQKERWCFQLGNKKAASGDRFMRCFSVVAIVHSLHLASKSHTSHHSLFALRVRRLPFCSLDSQTLCIPCHNSPLIAAALVWRDLIFMRYSPLSFYCEKSSSARQIARETRDTRLARPSRQFSTRAALTRE